MEQPASGAAGFREVDQRGNPAPAESGGQEDGSWPHKPRGRRANPFIAVLWALALALIAAGTWVFTANAFNPATFYGPTPASFLVIGFAPQAIFAGLATTVGLLFWHAWQWQRRRG